MSGGLRPEGEKVVTALAAAVQTRALYPATHPEVHDSVVGVVAAARALVRSAGGDPPPLFVVRRAFYLGPDLLPGASLRYLRLREQMEERGVYTLEIRAGVAEAAVATLVEMLAGVVPTTAATVGLDVNKVKPTFAIEGAELVGAVARAYELGVEAVRQAADSGRAELSLATRAVEALAEEVKHDTSRALLFAALRAQDQGGHRRAVDVAVLSLALARHLGVDEEVATQIGVGALLHDVGMLAVDREGLATPGPLDAEEWSEVHRHPLVGAGILLAAEEGPTHLAAAIALEHHVGVDGSGYPELPGGRPPSRPARIVAVADTYVALTSPRPHRAAESPRQALATIAAEAGARFDPDVVDALVGVLGPYPPGTVVRLTNGAVGVVVRPNPILPARPVVRVVCDPTGASCEPVEVDTAAFDGIDYMTDVDRALPPETLDGTTRRMLDPDGATL